MHPQDAEAARTCCSWSCGEQEGHCSTLSSTGYQGAASTSAVMIFVANPNHGSAVRAGMTEMSQLVRQGAPQSKSFCAQTQKDDEVYVTLQMTVTVHHHLSIVGKFCPQKSSAPSLPAQLLLKKPVPQTRCFSV